MKVVIDKLQNEETKKIDNLNLAKLNETKYNEQSDKILN